ncbi:Uncharacterized protein TCAP_06454 [Tolypocladium capitatum]|uniref:NTF2-like protein n=1 Tax=Tolypocladium capitatum TaxID=45235 RepID=A0A2K3Q7R5_9HYPO|nr:Uncharacterized protein TCAP_06454 [Tolypocladium capitatum]
MAAATYKKFLAAPNSSLLADKATLLYVTTTTAFSGATEIVKHLNSLQKQVKTKKQDAMLSIEGRIVGGGNAIAVEVDTALEFQTSGGVYLPGLDDNFLTDRVAHLAIIHIVSFDDAGKIVQIRQQWDQGSLLKQLDIIGLTGRNWPIKDSREQLAMIQSYNKAISAGPDSTSQGHNEVIIRTRGNSTNALRDPHASLQLFGDREELEAAEASSVVSPYAGNRPRQRGFAEILGDEHHRDGAHHDRSMSPSKVGQGKNYQPMRIFDANQEFKDEDETPKGGKNYIRPNPNKYEHFDFADGSDPQDQPERGVSHDERPKSKHDSQWSFNDFVTPARPQASKSFRSQDDRHWDTEVSNMEESAKPVGRGRRDAETHFELQDDGERVARQERPGTKARGSTHNEGLGLYKNNLFDQEGAGAAPSAKPLGNITNLKDRTKDFDPHFAMADASPSQDPHQSQQVPEGRMKAVKMMDANWSSYDKSPTSQKENQHRGETLEDVRIHIAGDGMGGKKGTDRDWLYNETTEQELPKAFASRKGNAVAAQRTGASSEGGEKIHIAGDGMGGKKGTNRDWLYGGGGELQDGPKALTSRKGNAAAAQKTQNNFWDF